MLLHCQRHSQRCKIDITSIDRTLVPSLNHGAQRAAQHQCMNMPVLANIYLPSASVAFHLKLFILVLLSKDYNVVRISRPNIWVLSSNSQTLSSTICFPNGLFGFPSASSIFCLAFVSKIFDLRVAEGSAGEESASMDVLGMIVQTCPQQKLILPLDDVLGGFVFVERTSDADPSPSAVLERISVHAREILGFSETIPHVRNEMQLRQILFTMQR